MAKKRMFRLDVLETDAFMDMPLTTQALYFHLNMRADDDGFVGNPRRITSLIGASTDDLNLLIAKRFVLVFEDGVIVIKHWRLHNNLTANRYQETKFLEDKSFLRIKENGSYSFSNGEVIDDSHYIEVGKRETRQRRDKDETKTNADKVSIGKDNINNIYIVEQEEKKDTFSEDCATIIRYLNEKTGKNYKHSTKSTRQSIHARMKEGFTVDDFKAVIDIKTAQWLKDSKMNSYLRPETLFGTKFEGYLNEAPRQSIEKPQEIDYSKLTDDEWRKLYNDGKVTMEDYYNYHE